MDLPQEDELRKTYRSASDSELLELALSYDSLTQIAQRTLRTEFERRGLEPPELSEEPPSPEYEQLVTVKQYRDLTEAQLAKSALESAGIPAYLRDENTVRMDWFYSNLLGGIRVQVREEDQVAAEALLSQPIPQKIHIDDEIPYEQPLCPRCGSLDVHTQIVNERMMPQPDLTLQVPGRGWRCGACGALRVELADNPPAEEK